MSIRSTGALVALAVLAFQSAPASAEAITFDFTGRVGSSDGSYAGMNDAPLLGAFTIDLAAANAAQSAGDPASSVSWKRQSSGGSASGLPVPTNLVFTGSVTVNGVTYSPTSQSGAYATTSTLSGRDWAGDYAMYVATTPNLGQSASFAIDLSVDADSPVTSYLSTGLPNLDALTMSYLYGRYITSTGSGLNYRQSSFSIVFDSITARSAVTGVPVALVPEHNPYPPTPTVPLPAAAWLFVSGLGLSVLKLGARTPGPKNLHRP